MAGLKARDFLFAAEDAAIAALPCPPPPERRVMWTILQYHFGEAWLHYELHPQVSHRRVEVGLHFESSAEQSERAARVIAEAGPSLMASLGDGWELEEWTGSWRRLHRVLRFDALSDALAGEAAAAFSALIAETSPLLQSSGLPAEPRDATTVNDAAGRKARRRRYRR